MKHLVRIGPWWLRVPVLLVLAVPTILAAAIDYGTHKRQWPSLSYWQFSVLAMWCAIKGDFVPRQRP